jgi:hypothetical protein
MIGCPLISRKFLIALLLSFSIIPVLLSPQTFGQAYTTVTTQMTTVNFVTNVNTQTIPISSYEVTTTEQTVLSEIWTQSGVGVHYCWITYYDFEAEAGQTVTGTIIADQHDTLAVYLLSDQQYATWSKAHPNYCNPADNNVDVLWYAGSNSRVTQANVQYIVKESGKYWFLVETYSSKEVVITLNLSTQYGQTTTMVLYSTLFSTAVYPFTQTATSVMTQQLPQSPLNFGSSGMLMPATGIVIVILLALIGYIALRRRKGGGMTRGKLSATPETPKSVDQFCISCGSKLSQGSKFCNRCGTAQT